MSKFTDDLEKNAGVHRIPDPIMDICERIMKEVPGVCEAHPSFEDDVDIEVHID